MRGWRERDGESPSHSAGSIILLPSSPSSKPSLHPPSPLALLLILSSFPALLFLWSQMPSCLYLLPSFHPSIHPSCSAASHSFTFLSIRPSSLSFRYRSFSSPSLAQFFSSSVQRFHLLTLVFLHVFLCSLQVRLLYCSLEEAEVIFRAAWAAGQAGPSYMWFAVGPALSGLGLEGLPKVLFAIRPQGWRDEPRR